VRNGALLSVHTLEKKRPIYMTGQPLDEEEVAKYYCYITIFFSLWMGGKHTEASTDCDERGIKYSQLTEANGGCASGSWDLSL
jgi:hypothetical protein